MGCRLIGRVFAYWSSKRKERRGSGKGEMEKRKGTNCNHLVFVSFSIYMMSVLSYAPLRISLRIPVQCFSVVETNGLEYFSLTSLLQRSVS